MISVRAYRPQDTDAVITLWEAVFANPSPHNAPAGILARKEQTQPELFFVAEDADKLIGTVIGGYDGHRGWLYKLAVHPEHRRKGIGARLVTTVMDALAERGCPKLNIQIFPDNDAVVPFYRSLGFVMEARISMARKLEPNG